MDEFLNRTFLPTVGLNEFSFGSIIGFDTKKNNNTFSLTLKAKDENALVSSKVYTRRCRARGNEKTMLHIHRRKNRGTKIDL